MNERLQRAKRIASLREQFYNLTKWKLSDSLRQQAILEQDQQNLSDFLEKDTVFTGRFAVTAMQRLHNIAAKTAAIVEYNELQREKVLQAGRLKNLSEKLFHQLECKSRSATERDVLNEVIEGSFNPRE